MPVYDCRADESVRVPGALRFTCNVKIIDPVTGQRIPDVFFLSTDPAHIGRFVRGPDDMPMVSAQHGRRRRVPVESPKKVKVKVGKIVKDVPVREQQYKTVVEYDRLERFEDREWVAVSIATGEIVAKSKGAP